MYSFFFLTLDWSEWSYLKPYRLHEPAEVTSRNRATLPQVLRAVVVQQVIQSVLGYYWLDAAPEETNHGLAMQNLSVTLGNTLPVALGKQASSYLLELHGNTVVPWVYWWLIPAVQFLFAMYAHDFFRSGPTVSLPSGSS